MKGKRAPIIEKVHPDLIAPPHIVAQLFHIMIGEWRPDPSQQEQLIAHFTECSYCRTALIVLLSAEQEKNRLNDESETPVRDLLARFVMLHHEIEAQDYEQMGAYAETIVAVGREKADKRFPILAEQCSKCPDCASALVETVDFLNESKKAD